MAARRVRRVVYAERHLEVRGKRRETVTVLLGKPRRVKEDEWVCPFWIEGSGVAVRDRAHGIDAMQALTCALEGIRVRLKETGKSLTWLEALPSDADFPRMIPYLMLTWRSASTVRSTESWCDISSACAVVTSGGRSQKKASEGAEGILT
jgi:hypothetical protein